MGGQTFLALTRQTNVKFTKERDGKIDILGAYTSNYVKFTKERDGRVDT